MEKVKKKEGARLSDIKKPTGIKDFQDEFMGNFEEFSQSWRD